MKLSVMVIVLVLAMAFTPGLLLHDDNEGKALGRYDRHVRDLLTHERTKRDCNPPCKAPTPYCRGGSCSTFNKDVGR
uniref:Conotoxin-like unassigned superfamily 04 n=1 Tax=Conus ermineus TaxID=55423 RepID=A0A346CJ37_CONER|nr:conotoxin-like precursor unassigned superfamily 04 [Conus ermineus]